MKKHREIALELTPLLDVILTLLFMVLITVTQQAQTAQKDAQQALNDANAKIEQAEKKLTQINQSAVSIELLQNNCKIVTVAAYNDEKSPEKRSITVKEGDNEPYEIQYDWSSLNFAKNSFKQALLNDYLTLKDDEQIIFIVFQYDSRAIYNYDYTFINATLSEINTNRPEVYLAYYNIPLSVLNGSEDNTVSGDTSEPTDPNT